MVVGRRRVAAASVATAYALHVYVLQHHFRPPQTARPAIPPSSPPPQFIPIAEKLGAQRSRRGYFSWVLVSLSPSFSLFLPHSRSFRPFRFSRTDSLDPPRPFQPSEPHIFLSHTYVLPSSCERRRAGKRRVAPYRAAHPLPTRWFIPVYPSIAHILSFFCSDFLPLLLMLLARLGPSQRPTPELK